MTFAVIVCCRRAWLVVPSPSGDLEGVDGEERRICSHGTNDLRRGPTLRPSPAAPNAASLKRHSE